MSPSDEHTPQPHTLFLCRSVSKIHFNIIFHPTSNSLKWSLKVGVSKLLCAYRIPVTKLYNKKICNISWPKTERVFEDWRLFKLYLKTVPTSQETQSGSIIKTNRLMLFGKISEFYCKNHTEHIHDVTQCSVS